MSERRFQEEKALREKHKYDVELQIRLEEERKQGRVNKEEEEEKIKLNNETIANTWDKLFKTTKRLKNDLCRWKEKKREELGDEVEVGSIRARDLLKEIETSRCLEVEWYPFINNETEKHFQRLSEASAEVKTIQADLNELKSKNSDGETNKDDKCQIVVTGPDQEATNAAAGSGNTEADKLQSFSGLLQTPLMPKPQRNQKKKKGTLRCRSCTECKSWCETSSRDASEWCYPCLYRKREGKSNKSGCKLRGMCKNPKIVDTEKGVPSEDDIETDDAQDETFYEIEDDDDKIKDDQYG